jgi:hypothetical protein
MVGSAGVRSVGPFFIKVGYHQMDYLDPYDPYFSHNPYITTGVGNIPYGPYFSHDPYTTRKKLTRSAPNMATRSAYVVRCG